MISVLNVQDSKKKEKDLASWEADLKRREKVFFLFNSTLNIFYMEAYHLVYVILKNVFFIFYHGFPIDFEFISFLCMLLLTYHIVRNYYT